MNVALHETVGRTSHASTVSHYCHCKPVHDLFKTEYRRSQALSGTVMPNLFMVLAKATQYR